MTVRIDPVKGSPEDKRSQERAAMVAEQAASLVEYVAMMADVEIPQDEPEMPGMEVMGDD